MANKHSLRRAILFILILLTVFSFAARPISTARAAAVQENWYTAIIQLEWPDFEFDSPLQLYFSPDGGAVKGIVYWLNEPSGDVYGLLFEGEYSGASDGSIRGTLSGYYFAKQLADGVCEIRTELTSTELPECIGDRTDLYKEYIFSLAGTWSGSLFPDGSGEGKLEMHQAGGTESGSPGTWAVMEAYEGILDPPAAPDLAFLPMLTDNPYPAGYEPPMPIGQTPTPETAVPENMVPVEGDFSQMPPLQIPAMAGAAVAGAILGLGAAQIGSSVFFGRGSWGGRKAEQAAMAYSPATGKLVPAGQAQQEHQLMNQGYVYRPDEGWVAPKGEYVYREQSLAGKQADAARAENKAKLEQWKADSKKRIEEEVLSDFRWNAAYQRRKAEALMRRQVAGYKVAEIAAETIVDVAACVLIRKVPVKVVGYAVETLQLAATEAYFQTKIVTTNAVRLWRGQKTSFVTDEKWHIASLLLNKVPFLNTPTDDVARITAEEAAKSGTATAARTSFEAFSGN